MKKIWNRNQTAVSILGFVDLAFKTCKCFLKLHVKKKSKPGKGNETNDPKCQCSLHNHRERNYSMGLENFNLTSGPWEDISSGQIELQGQKQNPLKL